MNDVPQTADLAPVEERANEYDPTTIGRIRAGEQMHFTESDGLWAALLGGSIQYQSWTPDESRVKGFSEGYNLALRHTRIALATSRAGGEMRGVLEEAVAEMGKQFAFYAREHTAAGKHEKAATNQRFAEMAAHALGRAAFQDGEAGK